MGRRPCTSDGSGPATAAVRAVHRRGLAFIISSTIGPLRTV